MQFTDSFVQLNISVLTQSIDVINIVLHQFHPWIINPESSCDSPNIQTATNWINILGSND